LQEETLLQEVIRMRRKFQCGLRRLSIQASSVARECHLQKGAQHLTLLFAKLGPALRTGRGDGEAAAPLGILDGPLPHQIETRVNPARLRQVFAGGGVQRSVRGLKVRVARGKWRQYGDCFHPRRACQGPFARIACVAGRRSR